MAASVSVPFILSGKYFQITKQEGTSVEAVCNHCPAEGKNVYKGSLTATTNFHSHLKRKHEVVFKEFERENKEHVKRRAKPISSSNSSVFGTFFEPDQSKCMSAFDKDVVEFIVYGMHPLSIVEEPHFRKLFKDRKLHSRDTYRRRIEILFHDIKQGMIKRLGNVPHICLTCDMWTCSGMTRSFMGITAHWIESSKIGVQRKSAALACRRFPGSHTYDRIAEFINTIMQEYQLKTSQIVKVVTDNASNFAKAFSEYGVRNEDFSEADFEDLGSTLDTEDEEKLLALPPHARCASHTLSLICTTDISKLKGARIQHAALAKCYGLWNKTSRSSNVFCEVKKITKTSLKTPVKTRWNSLYDSILNLLSHRDSLDLVFTAAGTPKLSESEIKFLESYCTCLKPIAEALDRLQGEHKTYYGELIPTLYATKSKLKKLIETPPEHSNKLPDAIVGSLKKRFQKFFELQPEVEDAIVAAVSHPFFKLRWVPREKLEYVKDCFLKTALAERGSDDITVLTDIKRGSESMSEDFFGFVVSEPTVIETESSETASKQECLNYLLNPKTDLGMLEEYPSIKRVFMKYNTSLPSSAPVERLFSYSNMVLCPTRRRLTDDMFEVLTLLKVNGF